MTMNTKVYYDDTPKIYTGKRAMLEEFSDSLFDLSYKDICPLRCTAYITNEPVKFQNRLDGKAMDISVGSKWAEKDFDCAWFHVTGSLPKDYAVKDLVFRLDCGGEGLIYDNAGNEIQGITCCASGFSDDLGIPVKQIIPVYQCLYRGNEADFWIDCGANDLFGKMRNEARVGALFVSLANHSIRRLAYDVQMLLFIADRSPVESFKNEALGLLLQIAENPGFTEEWAEKCLKLTAPLLRKENNGENTFTYTGIGHAHLDLAWRWPIRESKRKGARTFATQIKNIERYPDYVFGASQPQLYQWIKDDYPKIYSKVKELAGTPNWDIQGATWVEMDSNLISGESMIRQFYYGKEFFREEFSKDSKIFWVPDSFGYSGCIPQVMKLADVPYFLTQKMSWNEFNEFPYHTFRWTGIDGSTVLAHMLPENTYNSPAAPDLMLLGEKNYKERKISDTAMCLFGIGDGGAGPGYEHIEKAERLKNLLGFPKCKMEKSLDFFRRLDNKNIPYPSYKGELYLEKHQGTYTTQARNKLFNRKCEFLLRNYEILFCMAKEKNISCPIDEDGLHTIWKEILLYQFHDILPGSSINRVYEESLARYEIIFNRLKNAIDMLSSEIYKNSGFLNLNSYRFKNPLKINSRWVKADIPPFGFMTDCQAEEIREFSAHCTFSSIENDCVKVSFENGFISGLFNKRLNKQFVPEGKHMAVVSQYTDKGNCWDMINSKADYISTKRDSVCTEFSTNTDGAKAYANCVHEVGDCKIHQEFYILDGDPTVYCELKLSVKQASRMLRIAFPADIKTEEASFNVQFGHLTRRTTENNPVELAQFEVSAQKFVDLSEKDFGISLINDCKYGFRVKNGVIDMNLVRTPEGGPGENVDQGIHHIKYALFTHKDSVGTETYKKAYEINNPVIRVDSFKSTGDNTDIYTCDNDAVILETVKIPKDNNGIITRFYNTSEKPQSAEIFMRGYRMSEEVNIPEEKIGDKKDNRLTLHGFGLINIRWVKE